MGKANLTKQSEGRAAIRSAANAGLLGAVLSYAITLSLGVQSAIGSMLMVLIATCAHIWLAWTDHR